METRSAFMTRPERVIEDVLDDLEEGKVIPILGGDLFPVEFQGELMPLHTALGRACAKRLGLEDYEKIASINEVFVRHLGEHGLPEEVYEALDKVSRQMSIEPMDWLVEFAAIERMKLFVTTTFVDIVERAIAQARGTRPDVKVYSRSEFGDLDADHEQVSTPVVYHLFGRVSSYPNYVASEQDSLEFLSALQDKHYQPERLFDAFRKNNLLLLGCRFPDWVTRFFLRSLMGKSLLEARRAKKYLIEDSLRADESLVLFLSRFSFRTSMIATEPIEFVRLLTRHWNERHGARQSKAATRGFDAQPPERIDNAQGAVFISYASEDRQAAQVLAAALTSKRIPVWYDRQRLRSGDAWDNRIEDAVRSCAYFLPLISHTTDSVVEGYFRHEWTLALERRRRIDPGTPFIMPLLIDDTDLERARVPTEFRALQVTSAPAGQADEPFLRHMVVLMREYKERQERGSR